MSTIARFILVLSIVLIAACARDRGAAPIVPSSQSVGTQVTVFGATSRATEGTGFGFERASSLSRLELAVSIPPNHLSGTMSLGGENPDPQTDFVFSSEQRYSQAGFREALAKAAQNLPSDKKEVTIFVHGFNNTHAEVAFRSAQLKHDIEIPGTMIFYSWPSRGAPLGYAYDEDSALFARDGLEKLLRETRAATGQSIVLIAHSLGAQLSMETLRQMEIRNPGWTAQNLSGVVLMSPDLDVDLFRNQLTQFKKVPKPFVIFANSKDRALGLSQRLRGTDTRARLGNISSLQRLSDLPVQVIDTSGLKRSRDLNHFPAANSPTLISILRRLRDDNGQRDLRRVDLAEQLPGRTNRVGGAVLVELEEEAIQ